MNLFLLNIVLAIVWAALWGAISPTNLTIGFGIGFASLWVARPLLGATDTYFLRAWRAVRLIAFFLYELLVSSIRVALDVLTPQNIATPAILEMPLDVKTDVEILQVTNLISLTPGTLSLDVTPDRRTLIVHAMFADDPEAVIAELKQGMERMVKEVFEE